MLFDLMRTSQLLRDDIDEGRIALQLSQTKSVGLVLGRARSDASPRSTLGTFSALVERYAIDLAPSERRALAKFPVLRRAPVESVRLSLEAKTCLTQHRKALPRLVEDMHTPQQTLHAASGSRIAAAFTVVNLAKSYAVPGRVGYCPHCGQKVTPINKQEQPEDALRVIRKIEGLPQREDTRQSGWDAVALVLVDFRNDGTPAKLISHHPAPSSEEPFHYDQVIVRLAHLYETRFAR